MLIVDAHQDIAYNAQCLGRDYRRSALKKRSLEPATLPGAMLGLPEAVAGRVAVVFATLFVAPAGTSWNVPWEEPHYANASEAYRLASQQMDYYHRLVDTDDRLRLVRTAADLDAVLATWEAGRDLRERKQGLVILMEGADPIIEPKQFEEWYERGLRVVGPAWETTRYTTGAEAQGGLTALGRDLLETMAGFNAILDLSHMAEAACLEALDLYEGAVIASHSNPRHFRDSARHLSDITIRRLAERDGVMGMVLYNLFMSKKWAKGDPKWQVRLSTAVDMIDYVCQLTGSAAHVGIGTDFDGGFGVQSTPAEIDTIADVFRLSTLLGERGYAEVDIDAIMGGNMLRKLRQCLP